MICVHGETVATCWDSMTPQQRRDFTFLHGHAFDWALTHATSEDELAEEYAAWYAAANYQSVEDASRHDVDAFEQWRTAGPYARQR